MESFMTPKRNKSEYMNAVSPDKNEKLTRSGGNSLTISENNILKNRQPI